VVVVMVAVMAAMVIIRPIVLTVIRIRSIIIMIGVIIIRIIVITLSDLDPAERIGRRFLRARGAVGPH
jgi:hypothetical protein